MLLRSTGWLCTATICQVLAPAAQSQVAVVSPTPSLSPTAPASEAEQWKTPAAQPTEPDAEPQPPSQTTGTQFEQEPGWSGGLLDQEPQNSSGQSLSVESEPTPESAPAPVDPRSKGYSLIFGVIDLRPKMQFGITFDDNILISGSNPKRDVLYTISPGAILGVGDYLRRQNNYARLEYDPSLTLFQRYSTDNSLEHYLRFDTQYTFSSLALGAGFEYDKLAGPDRDIGGRVNRDIYIADLSATYTLSDKTSLDSDTAFWFRHYQDEIGSQEIINHEWANYTIVPKLDVAGGVAFGFLSPEHGGRQTYQQTLVRLRYSASDKLTFSGHAGVEFREFSTRGTLLTPVFGLNTQYALNASTTLSLNGSRSVTNSAALNGEDYTATRFTLGLTQHLIGNFFLTLAGGYENDAYRQATSFTGGRQREDNYLFFQPSLDYRLQDWASLSLSYFYQSNNSNISANSFRDRQFSLQLHFGF